MISFKQFLVLTIVLCCSCLGRNSEVEQVETDPGGSDSSVFSQNSSSPLCRLVRNWKRNLLEEFRAQLKAELDCSVDVRSGCTNVTCSSEYNQEFTGGILLHLCEKTPYVEFWARSVSWDAGLKWSHNFTFQESMKRVEIVSPIQDENKLLNKQYLNVTLKLSQSQSRTTLPGSYQYLVFSAVYELWKNESEKPFQQVIIVNSTRFPLNQLCGLGDREPQNLERRENLLSSSLQLMPSPRKRGDPKLDEIHTNANMSLKFAISIGDPCDPRHVFRCGNGASCSVRNQSYAVCECMADYFLAANGTCVFNPSNNIHPVSPTVQPLPSANTSTYSSALGALFSILILLAIAGVVFLGTRYHVFSRIRNRLPHRIPWWPFQRASAINDQVVMVDPFAHEDDDPPLL